MKLVLPVLFLFSSISLANAACDFEKLELIECTVTELQEQHKTLTIILGDRVTSREERKVFKTELRIIELRLEQLNKPTSVPLIEKVRFSNCDEVTKALVQLDIEIEENRSFFFGDMAERKQARKKASMLSAIETNYQLYNDELCK
jgi:hypothetical protein